MNPRRSIVADRRSHRTGAPSVSVGRRRRDVAVVVFSVILLAGGCAKYNTYYNAKRAFDDAEAVREDALKRGEDVVAPVGAQKQNYELAISKCQKVLDRYPGNSLTDDALFLMAKAQHRLGMNLSSIKQLELLFANFPQTPYLEEALFLQAVNYLMLGDAIRSQDLLDRLDQTFPDSDFRSQAMRSTGDNAFALEDWADARDAFHVYLEDYPEADDWDDVGLKLARTEWELENYAGAAEILPAVIERTESSERRFRANLLFARCLIRQGDTTAADALLVDLRATAEIYSMQGDVLLAEAESLIAQGDDDEAAARLETASPEWLTREVKPRVADLLAYIYLRRDDLEEARKRFQEAIPGGKLLEDVEGSRRLLTTIQDYLAAENQLPDADPPKAARLRLLQANGLLFGFDRPRRALDLYATVAADSAADSTVAARALYGAMLVHGSWLDDPDSAQIFADDLQLRYPASPQAYQARADRDSDLLGYLLAQRDLELAAARERGDLGDQTLAQGGAGGSGPRADALRRQRIYLQRRPDIIYPPPEGAALRQRELQDEMDRQQYDDDEAARAARSTPPAAVDVENDPPVTEEDEDGAPSTAPADTTQGAGL